MSGGVNTTIMYINRSKQAKSSMKSASPRFLRGMKRASQSVAGVTASARKKEIASQMS